MRRKHYFIPFSIFVGIVVIIFFLFRIPFFSNISWRISAPLISFFFERFHFSEGSTIIQLKEENSSLRETLVNEKKLTDENSALQDQFAHTAIASSQLLPAHIIGAPGFIPGISSPEYLVIDKGKKDGIHTGEIVIYKDNAVGMISQEAESVSQVQLLTNIASSIPVKTMRTNAVGIIKGLGGGEFLLDNVVLSDILENNDVVLTYGNQTMEHTGFPPDLIVGKITSIQKIPSALFQRARLRSLITVTSLTEVFIMVQK